MTDPAVEIEKPAASPAAKKAPTRVTAENRYPVYDLTESLAVADAVKNRGGNLCSPDQLGGFLDYKSTAGGAFAQRVAAAKAFGFIETNQGKYRVTARGEKALAPVYPMDREQAFRDAFLAVPLYLRVFESHRGRSLPQGLGLQNYLKQTFGIPPRVVPTAVKVLMNSAQQAGFFNATSGQQTHLIDPIVGEVTGINQNPPPPPLTGGSGGGTAGDGGGGTGSGGGLQVGLPSHGKLLDGLWEELPEEQKWSPPELAEWLEMFQRALRIHYRLPKEQTGSDAGPKDA